ncbi:MAG: hypothetical protein A2176_12555 [Spirochaetes bacterium RBG_13_51_14]|nr:MAG: hypothetical protein A2176_12555 [Spirochaetes bacterium RBG_13_51_14]
MKEFFIKASIFSFLIGFTIFGVIYLPPIDPDRYIMALVDKHRLLETTPQPRIIFAGDSGLAFGLDSRMIKRATGYNIINMGLHGGLGLIYSMDELKPYLRKGDIVIFAPDYTHYMGTGIGDNTLVEVTILFPWIIRYYSKENYMSFISNIPLTFQRRLRGLLFKSKELSTHRRSKFNEFGDNEGHIGMPQPEFKGKEYIQRYLPQVANLNITRFLPDRVNVELVKHLNAYAAYCAAQGVSVYITFSPLMENDRPNQERMLRSLEKDMWAHIRMKVFGDAVGYIYPKKYFFDNEFHLNGTGREIRTRMLIETMKQVPELAFAPKQQVPLSR